MIFASVPDPQHFGTDTDPDPALLFSALKKVFSKVFCLFSTFTSVFKDETLQRLHKSVEIMFFLIFCLLMEGSGSEGPQIWRILRIRIRKTNFCHVLRLSQLFTPNIICQTICTSVPKIIAGFFFSFLFIGKNLELVVVT